MFTISYYVYILECDDKTLYTGYTTDLQRRLNAHNKGVGAKYTKTRLPVRIIHSEELETKSLALKREAQIKKLQRREKLLIIDEALKNKTENG